MRTVGISRQKRPRRGAGAWLPLALILLVACGGSGLPTATPLATTDALTPYKDVTTYNNFWEFGEDKPDASMNAGGFKPW